MNTIKHRKNDTKQKEQVVENEGEVIISSGVDTISANTVDILPTELPEEITNGA